MKIEQSEVFSLLNENLKDKITVSINGTILNSISLFEQFSIDFLSRLTFILAPRSYIVEELIFNEDQYGQEIFFIVTGKVIVYHKKSMTFLTELEKDDYFGEISFFSDFPRSATVKSTDYTDVMTLN